MSSLPLLSHRLFVSAISQEEGSAKPASAAEPISVRRRGLASAIPFELLASVEPARPERRGSGPRAGGAEPGPA